MPSQWYCRVMGTEMGPLSSSQLLEMARHHQLTPDDAVRKGDDGRWVEASRVKGLFEDPSASTIVLAKLPPEVLAALDGSRSNHQAHHQPAAGKNEASATVSPCGSNTSTSTSKPTAVTWHYLSDEGKVGPLSFDELVVHGREGRLKPKTRVWSSTSPKWCAAGDVEGLLR